MTRTFIALETNEAMQYHLQAIIRRVAQTLPNVRWVDPASIHLTLAFLGELTDGEVAGAMHAVEKAARQSNPFSYRLLSRLGIFGSQRQPRVIWIGIEEPSGALLHLHRVLNTELKRRNFAIDMRPFSPHLTLARIKARFTSDEQQQLQPLLTGNPQGIVSTNVYTIEHIHVMKSELLRTGAHYTSLQAYALGPS